MKKKKTLLTAALIMTAALSCTAYAQEKTVNLQIGNAQMTVNGEVSELDSPPVIIDSRTLVPIRAIVEALDGKVDWDNAAKTATLTNSKGDEVKLTINSKTASYNGTVSELDTPPVIINERTMLPIRFVAESFGYKTDWNAADKSITISDGEGSAETDTKTETDKTTFDLTGYDKEYFAADTDGNEYELYYKEDDMYDRYLSVTDKNGSDTAVYKLTYAWGNVYKDKSGNTLVYVYDSKEDKYSFIINGTEKAASLNDEYDPVDEDGNVYKTTEDGDFAAVDKNGRTVGTYGDTGEMWEIYADESGNKAYNVHRRDGGYKDGFITPDGKYSEFELNIDSSFLGSDGRIYGMPYEYIVVFDENYNFIEDWKAIPDSGEEIYVGKDGTEYVVDGEFAESYTLKSGGKTIELTCDPEEEHNKELFAKGEYGSDDDIYYSGDDGKTYVAKDFVFTVYGGDGKAEDEISFNRYEDKYKSSNGKTYVVGYIYDEEKSYIKDGDEIIELGRIMG